MLRDTAEKRALLQYEPHNVGSIYMPQYHLYPSNPQILHQLVIELFVRAQLGQPAKKPFISYLPYGPIYKYGGTLARAWKDIFHNHPPYTALILMTGAPLDEHIMGIVTGDTHMHTWFGTIALSHQDYVSGVVQDSQLFAMHAKPLEAQFPFIRGYKQIDNVIPYIINTNKDQVVIDDFLDTVVSQYGKKACYVFIQPDNGGEKFEERVKRG